MSGSLRAPPSGQVLPVAPILSSPTESSVGSSVSLGITTDQPSGILYWIISTSSTPPSSAQIMAGQDSTGSLAAAFGSQTVIYSGVQSVTASLPSEVVTYYDFFMQANARYLVSNVIGTTIPATLGTLDFSQAANSALLDLAA